MLSDSSKSDAFRRSAHWQSPLLDFQLRVKQDTALSLGGDSGPAWRSNSFSAHERNRFLRRDGSGFADLSLISGADCQEDARSFALIDYDGDGWLDIALMSTNAPRFRLFRNRIGDFTRGGRVLSVRLEGGNHTPGASDLGNRDAVGAVVTAVTSKGRRVFRRSLGEGLASENASAVRVTLAPSEELRELDVQWPSGSQSVYRPKTAATSVTIREGDK